MTFLAIPDFRHGINRQRPRVSGTPGALWDAKNCVLSRGGDIESAKKFVAEYALPAGTFGLAGVNAVPVVFGTIATPGGMPADVSYKQLTYGGAANLIKVHDAKPFAGKMYVIAEYDDGSIEHYYDGVNVTEWHAVADASWDYTTVAKFLAAKINGRSDVTAKAVDNKVLVYAAVPGTGFTISTATTDHVGAAVDQTATHTGATQGGNMASGSTEDASSPAWQAFDKLASAVMPATSYANANGTGNRTGTIATTTTFTTSNGTLNNLVDGGFGQNSTDSWSWTTASNVGLYVQFDFGSAVYFDEFKWYQHTTDSNGTFKWQGSNVVGGASGYVDASQTFTLGGVATLTQAVTAPGSPTAFRYWRLVGVSGSTNSNPWLEEIEFKITPPGASHGWQAVAGNATGYLQYQFAAAKVIGSYTVSSANGQLTKAPKTWTLKGSNTGAFGGEETTLDTRASETAWGATGETRTYTIASPASFIYYRLIVTANNSDVTLMIDEMTLLASSTSLPTAVKTTIQANVAPVAAVRATATITVTGGSNSPGINQILQVAVGANNLLTTPVDFVLSNAATAAALALAITSAAVAGYSATAINNVVTIQAAPGVGATINGASPVVTVGGNVTAGASAFAGGVTAVAAVQQIEQVVISATSIDPQDVWKITVNAVDYLTTGRTSATGTLIHVVSRRLWIPVGSVVHYCKLSGPTVWSTLAGVASTDPGFIDTSADAEGNDDIVSLAEHNGNTAFFSEVSIRVYALDTDATNIKLIQFLESTGSISRRAPLQYGNSDVYYLSMTGLKSVRSRLGYNFAYTLDVGSALAPYLQEAVAIAGASVTAESRAVIEPREGRYMLNIARTVYVFSDFAESGVSGWTEIDLAFTPEQFVSIGRRVMARSGNTVYVYGGLAGTVYPAANEQPVTVALPFLDARDPAGMKVEGGYGMAGDGDWVVDILVDPNDETKFVKIGTVNKVTFPDGDIKVPLHTSHVAPRAVCSSGGKVTLSSMAFGYQVSAE